MDSTVIEEIAKQLGMAADQAGQFIAANLPNFAAMKTVQCTVSLVVSWSIVILCVAVAAASLGLTARERRKRMASEKPSWLRDPSDWEDYLGFWVAIFAAVSGAVALIIAAIMTCCIVPDLIGWQSYPEAMLIDMAIKAVG